MPIYVGIIESHDEKTKYIISKIDDNYYNELYHFHNKLFFDFYGNAYSSILHNTLINEQCKQNEYDDCYSPNPYELHMETLQEQYSIESLYQPIDIPDILKSLPILESFSDNELCDDKSYHQRFVNFFKENKESDVFLFHHNPSFEHDSDSDSD